MIWCNFEFSIYKDSKIFKQFLSIGISFKKDFGYSGILFKYTKKVFIEDHNSFSILKNKSGSAASLKILKTMIIGFVHFVKVIVIVLVA
jgi:hypothetical protein